MTRGAGATVGLRLRVMRGDDIAMGPGKAALLDAIAAEGSIAAAARSMGMSYRRAWRLVETMNRCFAGPIVSTQPGARHGAAITPLAVQLLDAYRSAENAARDAAQAVLAPAMRELNDVT